MSKMSKRKNREKKEKMANRVISRPAKKMNHKNRSQSTRSSKNKKAEVNAVVNLTEIILTNNMIKIKLLKRMDLKNSNQVNVIKIL
jgi:predicted DNA repair protein MutK